MKTVVIVALVATALAALDRGEPGVAAVLAVGVAALLMGRATRLVTGHTHPGDVIAASYHEAGHAVAAREVGGRVISGRIWPDGSGVVSARIPDDPRSAVTVLLAGAAAKGSDVGARWDFAEVERVLDELPAGERGRVLAEARAEVRWIIRRRASAIERDAAVLQEHGRL